MALNNTVRATIHKPTTEELQLPVHTMLPPGPGNNWKDAAFRTHHSKTQSLAGEFTGKAPSTYKPTYVRRNEERPEFSGSAAFLETALKATEHGMAETLNAPKPVSLEGKVLRFYAFHVEKIAESVERERVRNVVIQFYLHDSTVSISEPRIHNSGLQGGAILKRQRVPLSRLDLSRRSLGSTNGSGVAVGDGSTDRPYVELSDMNVGASIPMVGTYYHCYDCDAFTRTFLTECGVEVPPAFAPPEDPAQAMARMKAQKVPKSFESRDLAITAESLAAGGKNIGSRYPDDIVRVQRFINDSGKMLKFNSYWIDEETNLVRTLEIRYFIEDDTISIVESVSTGDAISKSFLSRRRVPKKGSTSKGVDLTFSGRVNGLRETYLGDEDSYYEASDIAIGKTFNLYGRSLVVYDCDECTREYMRNNLGIELLPAQDISHLFPKKSIPKLPVPPPTGFGSPEDSRASCKKLVLCAPKRVPPKEEMGGRSLRFQLKFANPERHEDTMRQFILTYFLEDDEIMISECALRNTGFTGGKFLRKQKLRKDPDSEDPNNFVKLDDIQEGAKIALNGFSFVVTATDKNSAEWLEYKDTNGVPTDKISHVNPDRLQQLLVAFRAFTTCRFCTQTEAFRFFDKDRDGKVTLGEMLEALKDAQITPREDEAVAILDFIDTNKNGYVNYKDFFAAVTNPVLVQNSETVDVSNMTMDVKSKAVKSQNMAVRNRVLKAVKERLEARCMNVFEMFRVLSTMPRAYRGRRADMTSLTNSAKDAAITPVQLRRGVQEHLGMRLPDADLHSLLEFFFPALPVEEYRSMSDTTFEHAVDLKTFQAKFSEMDALGQLH